MATPRLTSGNYPNVEMEVNPLKPKPETYADVIDAAMEKHGLSRREAGEAVAVAFPSLEQNFEALKRMAGRLTTIQFREVTE